MCLLGSNYVPPLVFLGSDSLLSDKSLSALVAVGALMILIFVIMRRTPGRSSPAARQSVRRESLPPGTRQPLRGEAERLLVELQEFGREIEGRLETRIHHLTRLIAEADRAIERLNACVTAAQDKSPEGEAGGTGHEGVSSAPESARDASRARILELAEAGMAPASIAREVGLPKGEVELVLGLERRVADRE